jgi:hypothetical protein
MFGSDVDIQPNRTARDEAAHQGGVGDVGRLPKSRQFSKLPGVFLANALLEPLIRGHSPIRRKGP